MKKYYIWLISMIGSEAIFGTYLPLYYPVVGCVYIPIASIAVFILSLIFMNVTGKLEKFTRKTERQIWYMLAGVSLLASFIFLPIIISLFDIGSFFFSLISIYFSFNYYLWWFGASILTMLVIVLSHICHRIFNKKNKENN